MKVQEIAFSCYPVTDIDRDRGFYEGLLGLKPTVDQAFEGGSHWIEYDIGPGTLALGKTPGMEPGRTGCSVWLEVDNFDAAIDELKAAEVEFNFGPIETSVCHMALVHDPDGNLVGIHRRKDNHA
ncbi:VOC family protein [Puniceicoccales bacterium CK1056]|uniref:VOC family protein n=1 Tax=Oceanipulchritudo coccoides TaxID=2706888 RepID=A0A6B2M0V0_9BACT|nr:VOC family protein [Oceanipulchritudo coccoides]NDV61949.1 VOC family protein [Oceanipulchritudo coccoides]